jgi:hypothetical protein
LDFERGESLDLLIVSGHDDCVPDGETATAGATGEADELQLYIVFNSILWLTII